MAGPDASPLNLSDLLHRVASTCLASPCNGHLHFPSPDHDDQPSPRDHKPKEAEAVRIPEKVEKDPSKGPSLEAPIEMDALMEEVFEAVGAMKRSYARLQEAHCPWDPVEMRLADEMVVTSLRRLARLRERYRRRRNIAAAPLPLAEAVAPYEAALEETRRQVSAKDAELESLKEKLRCAEMTTRKGRSDHPHSGRHSNRKSSSALPHPSGTPTAELFVTSFLEVKSASKSFVRQLLSLMGASSGGDIAAAVGAAVDDALPAMGPHHAKYAVSSYLHRKLFQGFEDESFYMEGSLSSLLHPSEHRRDCYSQFRDMRCMDPAELLGVLPNCPFGRWAGKVFLSIVSEGVLLEGGAEMQKVVERGGHPRTALYGEYLRVAKAVWMLHLLAFALEQPPSQYEAARGSEYEAGLMASVIRFPGGGVPSGWVVGFPVAPGFKLANGKVVRALVYPIPKRLTL